MTDVQNTETAAAEPEERTVTWRVLKLDDTQHASGTHWFELAPLTGSGKYGYYPNAAEVGKQYGEGDYLLIEWKDKGKRFAVGSTLTMCVVSERHYYEREDDQEES